MEFDRRAFFSSLGGVAAVSPMDSEAKADALGGLPIGAVG